MATIFPKLFRSGDPGSPVLNGNVGTLISLFDACLINGYNSKSNLSISRTGTVATATLASHGFKRDQIVVLSGANESEYNTEVRVLSDSSNEFTFYMPETSAAVVTGTVSAKVASLGWEKVFSGTNRAVYRSTDPTSNRLYLRVIDDGTSWSTYAGRFAEVRCFEECSGISSFVAPSPRYDVSYAYPWVYKINYAYGVSSISAWSLVGDSKIFYFLNTAYESGGEWNSYGAPNLMVFGDANSIRPGDSYNTVMVPGFSSNSSVPSIGSQSYDWSGFVTQNNTTYNFSYAFLARAYNQISQGVGAAFVINTPASRGLGTAGVAFPNPVDGSLIYSEVSVIEEGYFVRGTLPGLYCPGHNKPLYTPHTQGSQGSVLRNVGEAGKSYFVSVVRVQAGSGNAVGQIMLDLTGPWRS